MRPCFILLSTLTLASCGPDTSFITHQPKAAADTIKTADQRDADRATPGSASTVAPAALIVPGKSVGRTRLGEPYDSVQAQLGRPDASDAAMGKLMATWYAGHDPAGHRTSMYASRQMGVDEVSRIIQIRVTSPFFKTAEGLGPGNDSTTIALHYALRRSSTYREAGRRYRTMDTGPGILFELDENGRCVGVIVQQPDAGGTYLSFHPEAMLEE